MDKEQVEKYVNEFDKCAEVAVNAGLYNKACMYASISAEIQYQWNQNYTDDRLEKCIAIMAEAKKTRFSKYHPQLDVVLFYDGFGLDTRGLALIYLKALCDLGYKVIYVVPQRAYAQQPEIHKVTAGKSITFHYLQNGAGDKLIDEILQTFAKFRPQRAFFYTMPNDVEVCAAFEAMAGKALRYQINLTDHAFWLGKNAFDKCVEFREYGACVSHEYRKISIDKLCLLHYYPYFDQEIPFGGFPFSDGDKPVLFSGGSLYKTYDDKGTYYDIVRKILQHNKDVLFVYAGSGDSSGMEKLQTEFPKRVYLIAERRDLYAVMQHATLYLNTYPMLGGLMTQYAAIAGRLPLTLLNCPDNSLDGLLLHHEKMQLEFTRAEDLVAEADKLLSDDNYRKQRERQLTDCVMNEDKFRHELGNLLEKGNTDFKFTVHNIDTTDFRRPYIYRFTVDSLANAIVNKKTVTIWWKYPQLLIRRIKNKFSK